MANLQGSSNQTLDSSREKENDPGERIDFIEISGDEIEISESEKGVCPLWTIHSTQTLSYHTGWISFIL